jgi:hypothetical protein
MNHRAGILQCKIKFILILFALHYPNYVLAQNDKNTPKISFGVEADSNSRYVWRGLAFSKGPVNQSMGWVTFSGFTFYEWNNLVLNNEPQRGEINGVDVGISYAREWRKIHFEPAFEYWLDRPLRSIPDHPTGEASIKLSYPIGRIRVFTKQIFDAVQYPGSYYGETGVSFENKLSQKMTLEVSFNLDAASSKFNEVNVGLARPAFNLAAAQVSLTYSPGKFYLRPHFEFTQVVDRQLRRYLESPTIGNAGIALGFNF